MDGRCDGLWYVLLTDVVGPRLDRMAPTVWMECWRAAAIRYSRLQLHPIYMLTAHMQISRVPACPSKLNDRRRETRNGAYFGRIMAVSTVM